MAKRPPLDLKVCLEVMKKHGATEQSHVQGDEAYKLYRELFEAGCRFYKFLTPKMTPPFQRSFVYEAGKWMTVEGREMRGHDKKGNLVVKKLKVPVQICGTGFHAALPWSLREWAKAPDMWELEPNVRRPGDVVFGMGKVAFRRARLRRMIPVPGVTDKYVNVSAGTDTAPGVQPGGQAALVGLLLREHDAGRPVQRLRHYGEPHGYYSTDGMGVDEQVIRAGRTALHAVPERVRLLGEALPDQVYEPAPLIGPLRQYMWDRPHVFEDTLGETDLRPVASLLRELGVSSQQMDRFRFPSMQNRYGYSYWDQRQPKPYVPAPRPQSAVRRAAILALLGATVTNPRCRLRALNEVLDLPVVALKLLGELDEGFEMDSEDLGLLVYRQSWADAHRSHQRGDRRMGRPCPPPVRRAA